MSWLIKPLAAASALALSTLGLISRKSQKARFYLNLGLYSGTLGVISLWGVVVSILASAAGQVSFRKPEYGKDSELIFLAIRYQLYRSSVLLLYMWSFDRVAYESRGWGASGQATHGS